MIFATDVDGTILTDEGIPHKDTNKAFKYAKSKGSYIVIATGRPYSRAIDLLEIMPDIDFFICNNGSLVYDIKNQKIIFIKSISSKNHFTMLDLAKEFNFSYILHTESKTYTWPTKRFYNSILIDDEFNLKLITFIKKNKEYKMLFNNEIITQLALQGSREKCTKVFPIIQKLFLHKQNVFLTNGIFIDVNPLGISKWTGLEFLSEYLHIAKDHIATFGDSGNDLDMIMHSKEFGFAVENSTEDLIKIIKPTIGNNNTNAISKKIIELVNK